MTISCEGGYIVYKCKNCVFCTWACPDWMCMNEEHPDFDLSNIKRTDFRFFFYFSSKSNILKMNTK